MLILVSSWYNRKQKLETSRLMYLYMHTFCILLDIQSICICLFCGGKHNFSVRLVQENISYRYLASELKFSQELCKDSLLVTI